MFKILRILIKKMNLCFLNDGEAEMENASSYYSISLTVNASEKRNANTWMGKGKHGIISIFYTMATSKTLEYDNRQ
jgi:hypothetical protein